MKCIFGSDNQWTSIGDLDTDGLATIAGYERRFGLTIHRLKPVETRASAGTPYPMVHSRWREIAMSRQYREPVILDEWKLPTGAFGDNAGPT